MSLKDRAKSKMKNKAKSKVRKLALKIILPFLPYIAIVFVLFFSICSIIDAVFVQEVQTDTASLPEAEQELRLKCIEKAEYLNTCHNFKDGELTNYLLDKDNREENKQVEWSHLYAIMAFHNMSDNKKIDENLLNEVSKYFESTFKYETMTIKEEITTKDEQRK